MGSAKSGNWGPRATRLSTDDYPVLDIRKIPLQSHQTQVTVNDRKLQVTWTRLHFGGTRAWLICPNCQARKAILYIGPYTCRTCAKLAYASPREALHDRARRQALKIRARLKWPPDLFQSDGPKPKWMRWPTYHRLTAEHTALKRRWMQGYL